MVLRAVSILAVSACVACGCAPGSEDLRAGGSTPQVVRRPGDEEALAAFIEHHRERIAPLVAQLNLAYWQATARAEPGAFERLTDLEQLIRTQYADAEAFATVQRLRAGGRIGNPLLTRQLALLDSLFRENQLPAAVRADLVQRAVALDQAHGQIPWSADAEVMGVLMSEPDPRLRRRAWQKAMQRGALVQADLLALVKARNRAARAMGFTDFYRMRLELEGLKPERLEALTERMARETEAPFSEAMDRIQRRLARRYEITPRDLMPWHFEDPFFQRAPTSVGLDLDPLYSGRDPVRLAVATFSRLGWNPAAVLERSDLAVRDDKPATAFCLDVDRSGDVRIMASLDPGSRSAAVLLHELGHAFFYTHLPAVLPWLLRQPASEALSEAVALLFGDLACDEGWLVDVLGASTRRLDLRRADLRRQRRDDRLVFVRFCLLMIHFERELYRDPDQDLVGLWWRLKERYQHLHRPPGRDAPDWAAQINLASAPVYYHNYLLGQLAASQIRAYIDRSGLGPLWSKPAGRFLIDRIVSPGAKLGWEQVLEAAVRQPLDPSYFIRAVSGRPGLKSAGAERGLSPPATR